jgi:hypothetical protein
VKVCVFGLPRSRTAWFAAWLGAKHEALAHAASLAELPERMSDTATIFAPAVVKAYPNARYLFVFRDPLEVAAAAVRLGFPPEGVPALCDGLEEAYRACPGALAVRYEEIDARLPEIWAHLMDGPMPEPPGHVENECPVTDTERTRALMRECLNTES